MKFRCTSFAALVYLLALPADFAPAAPVNYDEAISGDLPAAGTPLSTFALDNGSNEWRGTFTTTERDSFAFTVPAGRQIGAGSGVFAANIGEGTGIITSIWNLNSGSANASAGTFIEELRIHWDDPSISVSDILVNIPQGAGTYNMSTAGVSGGGGGIAEYLFRINVVNVPEPATLSLAFGPLALLACRRQRTT